MNRWKRANKLKMSPPIEVLAVLLKEDGKTAGTSVKAQRAHMDELLGGRFTAVEQ